jgi:hypothetical protein
MDASTLSALEKRNALESLIFLVEKKDNQIQGQTCANGSTQQECINQEVLQLPQNQSF